MRVSAEDRKQVATVINGTEYRAHRGYFDMPDHHARAHLRAGNLPTPAVGGVPGGRTFVCAAGHRGFFRTCNRGGCESAPAVREG